MTKPARPIVNRPEKIMIDEVVAQASDIVSPVWPLKNFIAVNPLQGLENDPFETAVTKSVYYRSIVSSDSSNRQVLNREMIKWCSAFFDEGQATIAMPGRHNGFYRCFADLARFDSRLVDSDENRKFIASLPHSAADAITFCLEKLEIPRRKQVEFIRQSLAALPGWAGFVKWKSNWQSPAEKTNCPAELVDFVAVQMALTCLLWPGATTVDNHESASPGYLANLPAAEESYRISLLGKLIPCVAKVDHKSPEPPLAQLVFCIDVRSEPFRRAIESVNNYETLGFAGFFGIPVRVTGHGEKNARESCPVLLKPGYHVQEKPCCAHVHKTEQHERGRGTLSMLKRFYQSLKYQFATPFALVEILGPWCGLLMSAKTMATSSMWRAKNACLEMVIPKMEVSPSLDEISHSQQADMGEQALRMMGLTSRFAQLVVLCGHGSTTENNAYASALDCGACGGNHGGSNARILARMLNSREVRLILADRGLNIPEETLFLAAEHDTTTDEVQIFGVDDIKPQHTASVQKLMADLAAARAENTRHRCMTFDRNQLDANNAVLETVTRSRDWAQVRPEWGLAKNAAFIVGPRVLTREINLEGRCFLHSYDWKSDDSGKFLTTILTAPMVVAQWINTQYFFSTVDPVSFGAGSKVTQNITGKIGVMQGNASDLMHGLPLQSVYSTDDQPYHEPLRLLTVVYAPKSRIDTIIGSQQVLRKLFGNGWVHLVCVDPTDDQAYLLNRQLTWNATSFGHSA